MNKTKPKTTPRATPKIDVTTPVVEVVHNIPAPETAHNRPMSPTTTEQEDITTEGQRKVNMLWERTQAIIAIIVVGFSMIAAFIVVVVGRLVGHVASEPSLASAWTILATAVGLVVGFYFSRTNHAAIGGVGKKPPLKEYEGR